MLDTNHDVFWSLVPVSSWGCNKGSAWYHSRTSLDALDESVGWFMRTLEAFTARSVIRAPMHCDFGVKIQGTENPIVLEGTVQTE